MAISISKIPIWAFLLFFVTILVSLVLTVAISIGVFKRVEIKESVWGGKFALYTPHLGEYHKVDRSISKVEDWAKANAIDCSLTFGEYMDHPKEVEAKKLRSNVGCLLETNDGLADHPFKTKFFDRRQVLLVDFTGSPAVGPLKVYPKVEKFIEANNLRLVHSPIEAYRKIEEGRYHITYIFSIR